MIQRGAAWSRKKTLDSLVCALLHLKEKENKRRKWESVAGESTILLARHVFYFIIFLKVYTIFIFLPQFRYEFTEEAGGWNIEKACKN